MTRQLGLICILTAGTACSNGFRDGGDDPNVNSLTVDDDRDGFTENEGDCDDTNASVHPEAEEVPYDGLDNDCKQNTRDDDLDKDGYGIEEDCDDNARRVNPGRTEKAYNGVDDDCDEATPDDDLDNDGFVRKEDCDDDDNDVHPDAEENTTNGIDDDCDKIVDERFDTEIVDASCDCGASSAVSVDAEGNAHVVYADAESGEILYRIRDIDGAWSTAEVIVDEEGWAGEYLDVAIDSTDRPHIAFTILEADEVTRGLYYIYLDEDDVWSGIYDVDTGVNMPPLQEGEEPTEPTPFDVGLYVDIELDSRDNPLFAYMDNNRKVPVVAEFSQTGRTRTQDQDYRITGSTGHYISLALDSANRVHTAFHNSGINADVRYTSLDNMAVSEKVDTRAGYYTSLALRDDGIPCMSFYDSDLQDLVYSCRESRNWTTRRVLHEGNMGAYSSLVFTQGDTPNILYYDGMSDSLRMMSKPTVGAWQQVDVDHGAGTGQHISATTGPDERIYVTYYDQGTGALKFAVGE